jgi:tetratricopeptide (TPR) repeat protein
VKLGRYRSFTVIAAHTAAALADAALPKAQPAQAKVDFLVNTSVKPSSGGWSMTFRLTETATGVVLWVSELAWRPETLGQIFDLLIGRVVGSLVDAIERNALKTPPGAPDVTAYRLYLKGQRSLKSIELQDLRRARKWFRDSASHTAAYAAPLVGLSRSLFMEWLVRGMKDPAMLAESAGFAGKALELDPFDWRALRERGLSSLYMRRHDESLEFFEKAILLGPNDADLLADYADALAFSGDPGKGLAMCQRAIELNPIVPGYYSWILGSILYQQHRYGEALEALEPVKNNDATARLMAACSARAGLTDQARHYARKVREVFPGLKAEHIRQISPNRRAEDMDHLIEGVRMAGID